MSSLPPRQPSQLTKLWMPTVHNDFGWTQSVIVESLSGLALTTHLEEASLAFDERFESVFQLKEKSFKPIEIEVAKYGLAGMIGGIGYYHGYRIVDRAPFVEEAEFLDESTSNDEDDYFDQQHITKPKPQIGLEGPASLFTAVPSRPFFPRGFFWYP